MLYVRHEVQAFLTRARHLRSSQQVWHNTGIVMGGLDTLKKDIDRDRGRLQVASAKYSEIAHPEAPALESELAELADMRALLFVAPE